MFPTGQEPLDMRLIEHARARGVVESGDEVDHRIGSNQRLLNSGEDGPLILIDSVPLCAPHEIRIDDPPLLVVAELKTFIQEPSGLQLLEEVLRDLSGLGFSFRHSMRVEEVTEGCSPFHPVEKVKEL